MTQQVRFTIPGSYTSNIIDQYVINTYFNKVGPKNSMNNDMFMKQLDAVDAALENVIRATNISKEHLEQAINYARWLGLDGIWEDQFMRIAEKKLLKMQEGESFDAEEELARISKDLEDHGGKKRKPKRRKSRTKRKKYLKKKSLKRKKTRRR